MIKGAEPNILARCMKPVAAELLGGLNEAISADDELKFGNRGSISVDLKKGTFFDHAEGKGGGVVDLVMRERHVDKEGALAWLRDRNHLPPSAGLNITARYPYTDLGGNLVFEVIRLEPKSFRQRRPDGAGGWLWKMAGVQRVLYRLPAVAAAVAAGETVFVVEGEKAADRLAGLGVTATCSPGGANKWQLGFGKPLAGADVVILPDNDHPGREHAAGVAKALQGIADRIRILALPGLSEKGDVADWIAAGGTVGDLKKLVAAAPQLAAGGKLPAPAHAEPDKAAPPEADLILKRNAPLDTAKQFVGRLHTLHEADRSHRTLHHQNSSFYSWHGSHYVETAPEETRAAVYRFLDGAKAIDAETGALINFDPNKNRVANVVEALAAEAQLPRTIRAPAWLPGAALNALNPADLIECHNGLLHLPTRELLPHTPALFSTNCLPFDYNPAAPPPARWLGFLSAIWPEDPGARDVLQELFGLALTADTTHQKAFLIVGPKRSGKGTIARVMTEMLGTAAVCSPTLSSLAINFGLAPMISKRLAIISDARLSGKADQAIIAERVLAITGEDALTIDRKFRDAWTGKLEVRFLVLTNELPRLTDSSGALASRFIVLVMTSSFYGKEDHGLLDKLRPELPGILLWALEGLARLRKRGHFVPPASSANAVREMEDLGSPIGAFLRECCQTGPEFETKCDELYQAWCDWCRHNGRERPGSTHTFGRDLSAAVPGLRVTQHTEPDGRRSRYYQGATFSIDFAARDNTRAAPLQSQLSE